MLARREHVDRACDSLTISYASDEADDALVDRTLWKLGFDANRRLPDRERFWTLQAKMVLSVQSAVVSSTVDHEALTGIGANYFKALEELLSDSLIYSTWALTSDHTHDARPFTFSIERERTSAHEILTKSPTAQRPGDGHSPLVFNDKSTLYALVRGFQCLASHLEEVRGDADDHLRSGDAPPGSLVTPASRSFRLGTTLPS